MQCFVEVIFLLPLCQLQSECNILKEVNISITSTQFSSYRWTVGVHWTKMLSNLLGVLTLFNRILYVTCNYEKLIQT